MPQTKPKFKVGDEVLRITTGTVYPILKVLPEQYIIELPNKEEHYISHNYVDEQCRKLTKLEKALK